MTGKEFVTNGKEICYWIYVFTNFLDNFNYLFGEKVEKYGWRTQKEIFILRYTKTYLARVFLIKFQKTYIRKSQITKRLRNCFLLEISAYYFAFYILKYFNNIYIQ